MAGPGKPGPKKHDTTIYKGAAVVELAKAGETPGQIAEDMGISVSLVDDILKGRGHWASLDTDQMIQQWRQKNTRKIEIMARELSVKALQRIEDTMNRGGLSQAVVAFGVLQDKARLLAGESTQNIAFGGTVRVESEKLTDMLAKLVSSLSDPETPPIEAQIVDTETEKPSCTTQSKPESGLGLSDGTG